MTRALADQPKRAPGTRGTKASIARACAVVADRLGNTVAVCRKSYIHPAVIDAYESGALPRLMRSAARRKRPRGLLPDEGVVLYLLDP
jgi:DNA topoisomerase-1